eukprot:gene831-904_t
MGNTHAIPSRSNRHSADAATTSKFKPAREHKRHGVVSVKIHPVNGRSADDYISQVLTPKGGLFYGSSFNPAVVLKALEDANYPLMPPTEVLVPDSRAHKLLVTYCQGWQLIPFPEVFSRHSGTCVIVGDRNMTSIQYPIKVGDCFRLGSVGVVVSELKLEDCEEERLDARTLEFLKDEALAFDTSEDLAALASDEMIEEEGMDKSEHSNDDQTEPNYQAGLTNGEKYICYMCYETHNTFEDPLIAPCECKGDTRFLHVQCLQKWYHSSAHGSRAQVIRTTGNGAPACKICGTAYKTNFRRPDGKKTSILEMENNGPYLSLVVVTHHDTNPGLFNTKFRLNFGRRANAPPHLTDEELNTIIIGRSSSCAMILDYRTVSTIHAKIQYVNGKFILTDNHSSNGTMVYLQNPFPLPYSQPIKVRMGRTTLSIQAKRSWTAAIRSYLMTNNGNAHRNRNSTVSVSDISTLSAEQNAIDMSTPSPFFVHSLLCALPASPSEKNERNDSLANEQDFIHGRSYTIRTLNDPGAEVEYDHDLYNAALTNSMTNMNHITSMTNTLQNNLQAMHNLNNNFNTMNNRLYGNYLLAGNNLNNIAEINNNILMNNNISHLLYGHPIAASSGVSGDDEYVANNIAASESARLSNVPSHGRVGSSVEQGLEVDNAFIGAAGALSVERPSSSSVRSHRSQSARDNSVVESFVSSEKRCPPTNSYAVEDLEETHNSLPVAADNGIAMTPVNNVERRRCTFDDDVDLCGKDESTPTLAAAHSLKSIPCSPGVRSHKSTIILPGNFDSIEAVGSQSRGVSPEMENSAGMVSEAHDEEEVLLARPAATVFSGVHSTSPCVINSGSCKSAKAVGVEEEEGKEDLRFDLVVFFLSPDAVLFDHALSHAPNAALT